MDDIEKLGLLEKADWICETSSPTEDEYYLYKASFDSVVEDAELLIAGDSDAIIYLNDELVYFGISPSYPEHLIGDKKSIKLNKGHNDIRIEMYYFGSNDFSSYCKGDSKLKFVITSNDSKIILKSDESISSCKHPNYISHLKKRITPQLGYSYCFDANGKENEFHKSYVVKSNSEIEFRLNKKIELKKRLQGSVTRLGKGHYLIDFNKEVVGYLDLDFVSNIKQKILIAYAEHKEKESIVYQIEGRDFSFEYIAKEGENKFLGLFKRLGLRYLEVFAEDDIEISYFGIREVKYPFIKKEYKIDDPLVKKIYDTCVYTLECCYHEHYEDCPWREQCLYAMDSLNQAVAGFVCFTNVEQLKSSLILISQDYREDHLLSICSPSKSYLTIPSFSLYYFFAVDLYYQHTKDKEALKRIYPKLKDLMNTFFKQYENGLIYTFNHPGTWNFYEWQDGLEGGLMQKQYRVADVIINGLFVKALRSFERIEHALGINNDYSSIYLENKEAARKEFLQEGFFKMSKDDSRCSQYGNALAILVGYATKEEAINLAKELTNPDTKFIKSTLSSKPLLYDALLEVNSSYSSFVLGDIKRVYGKMLEEGATTFYETELGYKDFNNAGSLCHGWASQPICYFNRLGLLK